MFLLFMQGLLGVRLEVSLPAYNLPRVDGNNKVRCTADVWKRVLLTTFNKWSEGWYSVLLVECSGNNCIMVDRNLQEEDCQQLLRAENVEQAPFGILKGPLKLPQRQEMIRRHIMYRKHPVVAIDNKKIIIYFVPGYDMASIERLCHSAKVAQPCADMFMR